MSQPSSPRPWRRLALASAVFVFCVVVAAPAGAAADITFIRTYNSEAGQVFEVCRGTYDPPTTDPLNPAYCDGKVLRWTQAQWQAYQETGALPKEKRKQKKGPPQTPKVAVGGPRGAPAPALPATPYGGSLDPTTVLGIENPLCGERGQLSAAQIQNCRTSHSPEAAYPVGNYGWDIHIEEGGFIASTLVPVTSLILQIISVLWLILLMVLKGCLIVLGFTFSLSPFTDNEMLREITSGLGSFYRNFTAPWLTTLMVVIGGWALWNGIFRRRAGETLGGIVVTLVMMLGAMWIIHAPKETVGRAAAVVNEAGLMAVAAPSARRVNQPIRSYNDAMSGVWEQMSAVPFCAMNFSDVTWCLNAKPSEDAVEAARDGLSIRDADSMQLFDHLPQDEEAAERMLGRRIAVLFGGAPTIRELYLRFSPYSGPRDALWEHYNGKPDDHVGLPLNIGPQLNVGGGTEGVAPEKVAMQGRSGLVTRIALLLIFAFGLLGGLALLLWIAMKLVMAAAATFVLVLATPLAMFFPAFGQAGRAAFVRWLTALLGAIVAKLIFSVLLGIVLVGSTVLGAGIGGSSPTLGLIATMAFWWAVFLSRERYLALLQIDRGGDRDLGLYRTLAGGYLGYRMAKAAKNAVTRRRDARDSISRRAQDQDATARRELGERDLDDQAHRRLDMATSKAADRDAAYSGLEREAKTLRGDADVRALRDEPSRLTEAERKVAERKTAQLRDVEDQLDRRQPSAKADRRLLSKVRANEAAGLPRHSRSDVEAAKEAIRREATLPADAPEHHWRAEAAGLDPRSPEGREVIQESLARTQGAVDTAPRARIEQIDLHRARRSVKGQRRPDQPIRRPGGRSATGGRAPDEPPRVERRTRVRDWLSR